jgi:hypothetical protein
LVGAAVEIAIEAVVDIPESRKRSRVRRILYWSILALIGGFLLVVLYLALG